MYMHTYKDMCMQVDMYINIYIYIYLYIYSSSSQRRGVWSAGAALAMHGSPHRRSQPKAALRCPAGSSIATCAPQGLFLTIVPVRPQLDTPECGTRPCTLQSRRVPRRVITSTL